MPAIPVHIKQAALENIAPKLKVKAYNEWRVTSLNMNGKTLTLEDVRHEIEIESEEGYRQAQIWARPESEILEEIRKAKALSH